MAEPEEQYELVMPLLPVASRGGPFDDVAYVCGFEMGLLDMQLGQGPTVCLPDRPIHEQNREQADLLAMRHGYLAEFSDTEVEGWIHLRITRPRPDGGNRG